MGVPAPARPHDFLSLSSQLGPQTATELDMQIRQAQAQANYAQIAAQAQQIAWMGNMAAGARYMEYTPPPEDPWKFGPPKPKYKFMQRTKQGRGMRAVIEVLFWLTVAGLALFSVIIPVAVKLTSALWGWALT